MYLVSVRFVMPCLVDIAWRSALLRKEMEEEWISWGDGKWREGLGQEGGRETVLGMYKRRINQKENKKTEIQLLTLLEVSKEHQGTDIMHM